MEINENTIEDYIKLGEELDRVLGYYDLLEDEVNLEYSTYDEMEEKWQRDLDEIFTPIQKLKIDIYFEIGDINKDESVEIY